MSDRPSEAMRPGDHPRPGAEKVLDAIRLFDGLAKLNLTDDELEAALWASEFDGPLKVTNVVVE